MEGTLPDYDVSNCHINYEDLPAGWEAQDVLENQTFYRNGAGYEVVIGFGNDGGAYTELNLVSPNEVEFVTDMDFGVAEGPRAVLVGLVLMETINQMGDL